MEVVKFMMMFCDLIFYTHVDSKGSYGKEISCFLLLQILEDFWYRRSKLVLYPNSFFLHPH